MKNPVQVIAFYSDEITVQGSFYYKIIIIQEIMY